MLYKRKLPLWKGSTDSEYNCDNKENYCKVLQQYEKTFLNQTSLTDKHLLEISNNFMLSDTVIHVAETLLIKAFLNANGLKDPVLGQLLNFNIKIDANRPIVRVLQYGGAHWLAITTYFCKPNEGNG